MATASTNTGINLIYTGPAKAGFLLAATMVAGRRGYDIVKNNKSVFGKSDFTFKKYKVAVFVDGEFFHGKDWETKKKSVTNADFWIAMIERNMQRDKEVNEHLRANGWTVLRFWSQEVKKNLDGCVAIIKDAIDKASAKG